MFPLLNSPFKCEYARTNRSKCRRRACEMENIEQNELRVANVMQSQMFDGKEVYWYHVNCFFKEPLEPIESVLHFDGFCNLRFEDQERLKRLMMGIKRKRNVTQNKDGDDVEDEPLAKRFSFGDFAINENPVKQQSDEFFELLNLLRANTEPTHWIEILQQNYQAVPYDQNEKLLHVTDVILFGALSNRCNQCNQCNARPIFKNFLYRCNGFEQYAQCNRIVENPERRIAVIPESLRNKYPFIEKYRGIRTRWLNLDPETEQQLIHMQTIAEPVINNNNSSEVFKTETLKNGNVIDPDKMKMHVYNDGKLNYCVYLIDIGGGRNSYYKIKLFESDRDTAEKKEYLVRKKWGRIGTTVGCSKTYDFLDVDDAIHKFCSKFTKRTANIFGEQFEKKPGKYNLVDIDYRHDISIEIQSPVASVLPESVQNLVRLLFSEHSFDHLLLEFDLDVKKMPLGKLSEKQLQKALKVLERIELLIKNDSSAEYLLKEASNEFYALVPHNTGMNNLPIINSEKLHAEKYDMVQCLQNIELTFTMLNKVNGQNVNAIDFSYHQLNAKIEPLDCESEEFKLLVKYVKNSHAKMHDKYELKVRNIFKVARNGEEKRYEPFAQLSNRQLLFYGTRLTNVVNILLNGLRIAPPEAPLNGHMFGKGVYFADMVSKSANYCNRDENNSGLVLLCQVALGKTKACYEKNPKIKLEEEFNSAKGIGKTYPNPDETHIREDGVKIPLGKPISERNIVSQLEHHEYIVYNESQIKIEYLLELEFIYKK